MRHYLKCCFLAVASVSSCHTKNSASLIDTSSWTRYELDSWELDAPKGTKVVYLKGIDSVPGNIILAQDSIKLEFDSGYQMSEMDTICSLGSEAIYAKREIARGAYNYLNKPDTLHSARIDTVNGRIATIITSVKPGRGTTEISISDCKSHTWIGVSGKNIPAGKQEFLLMIYKSLRRKASK